MKPSELFTELRLDLVHCVEFEYTGHFEDRMLFPVMFLLLIITMTLEGFWQGVEMFVNLRESGRIGEH